LVLNVNPATAHGHVDVNARDCSTDRFGIVGAWLKT
jgi:hypothetical protein